MTKRIGELEVNVTGIEPEHGISAGIRWKKAAVDMVPFFEEHLARVKAGISLHDWYHKDEMERALVIAIFRIENAAKNLQAEAEIRAAKRTQKK